MCQIPYEDTSVEVQKAWASFKADLETCDDDEAEVRIQSLGVIPEVESLVVGGLVDQTLARAMPWRDPSGGDAGPPES